MIPMIDTVTLKELSLEQFDEIKTLFVNIFTHEPWNDDWSDEHQLNEYLLDLLMARNPLAFGLFAEGCMIGMAIGYIKHWHDGTEYYIEEFCITKELQGKGLGKAFFELMGPVLKEKGIAQYYLETNRTVPAYHFYQKLGFEELTDQVAFWRQV